MNSKTDSPLKTVTPSSIYRGLLLLLVLLLVGIPSVMPLFPERVSPATAPVDQFSGARAMLHLPVIATEPHPTGSPAQARVREYLVRILTEIGLEVEVQQVGSLENVVARLRGSDPNGAIIILTHYDTISTTPGAGDNGAAVSALLEIMRSLAAGPVLKNDVIALFDDCEEAGPFTGTKAFIRQHSWMSEVRVAISIDGATIGPITTNEVGPQNNGWLVGILAEAYTGGMWLSMSGGGVYNSTPFINAGIPVITLESNYPFRQYHTSEDTPETIEPGTVQQMGEQTVAIVRELGTRELTNPWGEQEAFFSLPVIGFIHHPQAWSPTLGITAGVLLLLALGLALWRGIVSWRELGVAFGTIIISAVLSVGMVSVLMPHLPKLFSWETHRWADWPEVIPPTGWLAVGLLALLVLGLCLGTYILFRRWSGRANFSLVALLPFSLAALVLAFAEPRAADAFIWSVLIGSLVWSAAAVLGPKQAKWALEAAVLVAALALIIFFVPFLPGVVMSDGMKSLNILAGIQALLLGGILPVVDTLLVRRSARN